MRLASVGPMYGYGTTYNFFLLKNWPHIFDLFSAASPEVSRFPTKFFFNDQVAFPRSLIVHRC